MIRSLWTAASGMAAQKLNMDVIANNLANVNTTGFKKGRADFEDSFACPHDREKLRAFSRYLPVFLD